MRLRRCLLTGSDLVCCASCQVRSRDIQRFVVADSRRDDRRSTLVFAVTYTRSNAAVPWLRDIGLDSISASSLSTTRCATIGVSLSCGPLRSISAFEQESVAARRKPIGQVMIFSYFGS